MPVALNGGGGGPAPKKKKKKGEQAPSVEQQTEQYYANLPGQAEYLDTLEAAEDASASTLPTPLVKALVGSNPNRDQVWQTANLLAQHWDISPRWFLPAKDQYTLGDFADPETGEAMTFAQARNFFKVHEELGTYLLLRDFQLGSPEEQTTEALRARGAAPAPEQQRITSDRLAAAFRAMAPVDADRLPFVQALAAGEALAADDLDLAIFTRNLEVASRSEALFPDAAMNPLQAIAIAEEATRRGIELKSPKDIAYIIDPTLAQAGGVIDEVHAALEEDFPGIVRRAAANPEGEEAAFLKSEEAAAIRTAGFAPADINVFRGMFKAIEDREENYITAGERIAKEQQALAESLGFMENTWVGKHVVGPALHLVEDVFDRTTGAAERLALDPNVWGLHPTQTAYKPLWVLGGGQKVAENSQLLDAPNQQEAFKAAMADIRDIWLRDANPYEQLADVGISPLVAMTFDLILGLKFGPDVLALKAWTKATRTSRLLASEEKVTAWADRIVPELTRAITKETEAEKFFLRVVNSQTGYFTNGLNRTLMGNIFHIGRNLLRAGRSVDDIERDLRGLLIYAGGYQDAGVFSTRLRRIQESLVRGAAETFTTPQGSFIPEGVTKAGHWALGALDDMDAMRLDLVPGGLLPELPHRSLIRSIGVWDKGTWRDTGLGKSWQKFINGAPPHSANELRFNLEAPSLVDDARNSLIRAGYFSEQEIASKTLELSRYADPRFVGREWRFANWLDTTNTQIIERAGKATGLSTEQVEEVVRQGKQYGLTRGKIRTYGFFGEWGALGTDPITGTRFLEPFAKTPVIPSQLLNYGSLVDPVALRAGIAEATGYWRQASSLIRRTVGASMPGVKLHKATLKKVLDDIWTVLVHDLFLGVWKPLAVMRPAYILRVVGIEEQGRFLSTLGLQERLRASRVGGAVADRLPGRTYSTIVRHEGRSAEDLASFFGYDRRNRFLAAEETRINANVSILDNTYAQVDIPLPEAGQLSRRSYAETQQTRFALTGEHGIFAERDGAMWVPMDSSHPQFYPEWHRDLSLQWAQDPIGQLHLQSILDERSFDDAVEWITGRVMSEPGYKDPLARLMGRKKAGRAAVELQVKRGQAVASEITAGRDVRVARAALEGSLTDDMLRAIPNPPEFINGALSETVLGNAGTFKRIRDKWGDLILRMPTNALSRHPYAAAWENRMREAMLKVAGERGAITPEQFARIQKASEDFAKLQVNRIMFDYTRSSRFGEATAWAFPFFQPYAEAFQVWGRIARQNPTMIAQAARLVKYGNESGIFERDENGVMRVPLSRWLGAGWFLSAMFHAPGFHTSAPLESFNLFFQAALNTPLPGFGEVPIPLPAFNPELQFVTQRYLYSDEKFLGVLPGAAQTLPPEVRSRLLTWVTQYGDVTPASIVPSYLRHFLAAAVPEWFEDQTNIQADNFLRLMAYKGVTAEHLVSDPEFAQDTAGRTFADLKEANTWLADHARGMGRGLSLWRGVYGALSPAAQQVSFPQDDWMQELQALRDQYPTDPGKVEETFIARHPDGWQFLVGNTVWNPQNGSPISMPANEAVTRFFQGKGAREFMRNYPEFAFFIIPHEIRDDYDFGTLWSQVGAGWRKVQSPEEKLVQEAEKRGWSAYFDLKEDWLAWQEAHPDADADAEAIARNTIFDGPVEDLKDMNIIWRESFNSFSLATGVDPKVLGHVRSLIEDDLFTQTDLGKALKAWVPLFDEVRDEMRRRNINNLYNTDGTPTAAAKRFGLDEKWENGIAIVETLGGEDWNRASFMFKNALRGVKTKWDEYTEHLSEEELGTVYGDLDRLRDIDRELDTTKDRFRKFELYQEKRELVNQYLHPEAIEGAAPSELRSPDRINVLQLEWDAKDDLQKLDYRNYISTLPYPWLTEFDRTVVLGGKTNAKAEAAWAWYNDRRNVISYREAHDPDYSAGEEYERLDREMAKRAKGNATLKQQIKNANTWAWGFFQANPDLLNEGRTVRVGRETVTTVGNPASDTWQRVWDATVGVRQVVDTYNKRPTADLTGISAINPEMKVWWNETSEAFGRWIDGLKNDDPHFERQWNDYADLMGDEETLFRVFFPETYFRIG